MPPIVAQMKPEVLLSTGQSGPFPSCLSPACSLYSGPAGLFKFPKRIKFVPSQDFPTASHLAWNVPYLAPYGLLLNQF